MELDKRINDTGSILTCFSINAAKEYLGQQGYFTSDIDHYQNLDLTDFRTLTEVCDDDTPFCAGQVCYQFFLPAEFVRPAEKKYRPYTLREFEDKFHIGVPIKFRQKGDVGDELYLILEGYRNTDNLTFVYIGSFSYTLNELFNEYEWQSHYTEDFEPFGVEVEE